MSQVRIRCTGLIIKDNAILVIRYNENGIHYNLPGGGLEQGETILEGVAREVYEETNAEVEVGQLALVYEFAPQKQSGDYLPTEKHSLHLLFECTLKDHSIPKLPPQPDPFQTAVEWVPLKDLKSILLIPNLSEQILDYVKTKRNIDLIEDFRLDRLRLDLT
ncbi:NUDIX domain-containing protein [Mesobacillus foraminis]|uniref:NUDIX domain-containing protein n=1 Tax=Mesobacillus foraminis TaxID=279826 RepID=UPI00399FC716